jgi:hypothetical protein
VLDHDDGDARRAHLTDRFHDFGDFIRPQAAHHLIEQQKRRFCRERPRQFQLLARAKRQRCRFLGCPPFEAYAAEYVGGFVFKRAGMFSRAEMQRHHDVLEHSHL